MAGIAFFDLDRTLLEVNSARLWLSRELQRGHISWWFMVKSMFWVILYELGLARMEQVLERAIATLRGTEEAAVVSRTLEFWHEEVKARVRRGALAALEEHRKNGDKLVLLTSSSVYMSDAAREQFGLDDILCNRFEVIDGRFTGRPDGPLCFGAGKLVHAQAWAEQHGVELAACTFYTDSYSDLPALLAVGRPVCVHPDGRLRREASRRGWDIAYW